MANWAQPSRRPYLPTVSGNWTDPRYRAALEGGTPFYTSASGQAGTGTSLNFPVGTAPAFGGGGMGGKGGAQGGLVQQYQDAYDKANAANEARYAEGKKGYADLRDRSMGYIQNMGQQQLADARMGFQQDSARARQNLINSGTASGSLLAGSQIGARRRLGSEERRINDEIQNRRLNTDSSLTQAGLGFLERRNDLLPDVGMLAQLAQGQAAAGGGGMGMPAFGGGGFGGRRNPFNDRLRGARGDHRINGGNVNAVLPGFGMRPGAANKGPAMGGGGGGMSEGGGGGAFVGPQQTGFGTSPAQSQVYNAYYGDLPQYYPPGEIGNGGEGGGNIPPVSPLGPGVGVYGFSSGNSSQYIITPEGNTMPSGGSGPYAGLTPEQYDELVRTGQLPNG